MNWRVVVAVVVALLLGVGAGALGEHERLKHDSNKKSESSSKTTTTTKKKGTSTPVAADWFGSRQTAACPALKEWNNAAVAQYEALFKPWSSSQSVFVAQIDVTNAAYRKLVPLATAAGKTELAFLLTYQQSIRAAVLKASSASVYLGAQGKLQTARVKNDTASVAQSAHRCTAA
jgi:hypothetical protein